MKFLGEMLKFLGKRLKRSFKNFGNNLAPRR